MEDTYRKWLDFRLGKVKLGRRDFGLVALVILARLNDRLVDQVGGVRQSVALQSDLLIRLTNRQSGTFLQHLLIVRLQTILVQNLLRQFKDKGNVRELVGSGASKGREATNV
jgi:hypothetical protein